MAQAELSWNISVATGFALWPRPLHGYTSEACQLLVLARQDAEVELMQEPWLPACLLSH